VCDIVCKSWGTSVKKRSMTVDDFRRIALSFEGAEESSHMGNPDFRVGGRIFATLASAGQGYGNPQLTIEQQTAFVEELPEVFLPVHGGWGRMGMTYTAFRSEPRRADRGAARGVEIANREEFERAAEEHQKCGTVGLSKAHATGQAPQIIPH
jgi:hypothetical protein